MATSEQVQAMLANMERLQPVEGLKPMDATQMGIGAVLNCLRQSGGPLTAGDLSRQMQVSTARVAVLLKKMESRGLITRSRSVLDARVTVVNLSPRGAQLTEQLWGAVERRIGMLIDEIGEEKLLEYFRTTRAIRDVLLRAQQQENALFAGTECGGGDGND